MKKGFILLALILASLFVSNTEVNADNVEYSSYTPINQFDAFTNVVIFIKFSDETTYTAPYDYDYYYDMFNGVDTISLRDYFLEVSYDVLTIDSVFTHTEIVYFVDANPRSYYQPYDESENTNGFQNKDEAEFREHTLLKNAVDWVEENNFIDDTIDLDVNNDGDIDSITFMISGDDNGWNNLLWPHKWNLYTYYDYSYSGYSEDAPTINGKNVWDYTFELLGYDTSYGYQVDVAVLAHETFHLISAPDLYHYNDFDWIDPIGEWGLMATIGTVPSHMLGYMKYMYGDWIPEVTEITTSGEYTLYPLQDSPDNIYRIPLGYSHEYIYLEYRDLVGQYESTLPDSGLIVYKVDEDFFDEGNTGGYYSNNEAVEEVWVYRPDMEDTTFPIEFALEDPYSDVDGEPYIAALSDDNLYDEIGVGTDILLFDSAGDEIELKITNIVEHDGYITFTVFFQAQDIPEIKLNGTPQMTLEYETYFYEPGFTVTDPDFQDNVTVEGTVDIYTLGDYIITYTLRDDEGVLIETKTRTVSVVDTTKPSANINAGVDTINIGETWIDAGVFVSDNYDTDLTIEITSELDNQTVGNYEVYYKVIDESGNYIRAKRIVNVVDNSYTKVDFTCNDTKTTYTTGEPITYPVCTYNDETLEITNMSDILNNQPGTYEILLETTIDEVTYTFRRYVFIISKYTDTVAILPEERRRKI
ncbi:hypothetical protein KQ51_01573 [Candidatus Izimaplasma bacterium HR1]|jgi:M6 family metalloprotease-like protein|uniref:immunoglobulin-like domain-containing protein n=1 Tax=Candidatus Izimoplasma sp. HR1 TaxID=1541959 RepID=UPI0004F7DCE7|nr:hypothetical protein KQ51_01573 [Candidatus Izimaplasma bacterium HR1]